MSLRTLMISMINYMVSKLYMLYMFIFHFLLLVFLLCKVSNCYPLNISTNNKINLMNELAKFSSVHKIHFGVIFKALEKLGVIPGYDMTGEAALTKLAYVIGLPGLTTDQQKQVPLPPSLKTTAFV